MRFLAKGTLAISSPRFLGCCSRKANCFSILQVCLDTGYDYPSFNGEDFQAEQGNPYPSIEHEALIQYPVQDLSQS